MDKKVKIACISAGSVAGIGSFTALNLTRS